MKKQLFLLIIIAFISTCLFIPKAYAGSYSSYKVKYKCPVRTKADENSDSLMSGNDVIKVVVNQELEYIKTELGPNNGKQNQEWYAVKFDYAAREYTGYVAKACMYDVVKYTYNDDDIFEESIKSFPESYKPYLRKLHAKYPSWKFEADFNKLKWSDALEAESQKGTSAISHLYPSLIFKDETNPDGIVVDGYTWYAPAKDAVAYYLDPRNFLTDKHMFMFEKLSYNSSQDSAVAGILKGSFMDDNFTEDGKNKTYADAFIEAGKATGVSSVHLASRSLLEMGTTKSSAASGTVPGYEGFYNFYNIGATSGADNYLKGLQKAKDEGWNSIQKAITGGANFIGLGYITKGQYTLYYQKFNVASDRVYNPYTHQYQTNIMAPSTEASSIYNSYKGIDKLSSAYTFTIPVYDNMPSTAYKVSRTDTVGGNDYTEEEKPNEENKEDDKKEEENKEPEKPKEPVVSPEEKVSKAGYSLSTGYLTKVTYLQDVSEIKTKFINLGYQVSIIDVNWKSKVNGKVSTGDRLSVDNKVYEIIVYGDSTGDGIINTKDLLAIQKYILGVKEFSNAFKISSDANKDGIINTKDLLRIQKAILGLSQLEQ